VGLAPFNPEQVVKFVVKEERPSSSESSKSLLKAEDWQHIEKLLKEIVGNMYDRRARRLNKTIHSLATENIILKMQNEGIKTSLMRQKSRRKQGKALELPLPQPNHGGAEFWSPRKIQQGLDWATAKEETAELLRAEKEEVKKRKAEEKLERQRIAAERQRLKGKGRQKRKGGRSESIDQLESDLNSEEDSV
jgi:regulator of replication initiation timing